MNRKKNIRSLGKTLAYLKDPGLRTRETGNAPLLIEDAEFSGTRFDGAGWRDLTFRHCDFLGAYEVNPISIEKAVFEDCRFSGIFNLGVLNDVRFTRCLIADTSHVVGDAGSVGVVFESCEMLGNDPEPNHWGSFGAYGEVSFVRCKARRTNLSGETRHLFRGCEFEDVHCGISKDGGGSVVRIEDCKLRGTFRLAPAVLRSLTVRDTTIETLDLTNATVQGDVVMERVKGGALQIGIQEGARNFVLRDSQIYGDGDTLCTVYAGAFQSVLVENTAFGGGPGKRVVIGGGFEPDEKNPQPVMTQSIVFRGVQVPSLRTGRVNAAHVLFEGNTIDSLELMQSRIGKLEIRDNSLARSVDFTDTQVGESNVQPLADGQAKLEGSNIRLVR